MNQTTPFRWINPIQQLHQYGVHQSTLLLLALIFSETSTLYLLDIDDPSKKVSTLLIYHITDLIDISVLLGFALQAKYDIFNDKNEQVLYAYEGLVIE